MQELRIAEALARPDDAQAQKSLAEAYAALGEVILSAKHAISYIRSDNLSAAGEKDTYKQFLATWEPRFSVSHITGTGPKDMSNVGLAEALDEVLTKADLSIVVNPLKSTSEMKTWAASVTRNSDNDEAKAKAFFDSLVHFIKPVARSQQASRMTAQLAFATLSKDKPCLNCEEATFLYVALVRSAGVRAFAVDVIESCDGSKLPHACAAIYPRGAAPLLVDLAYYWFGAPHKQFEVFDDLKTMAMYFSSTGKDELVHVASKLAPECALVQYNECLALARGNRWSEIKSPALRLAKCDRVGALTAEVKALIAEHDGQTTEALHLMMRALELNPDSYRLYLHIGRLCLAMGLWRDARSALVTALGRPHPPEEEDEIQQSVLFAVASECASTNSWTAAESNYTAAIMLGNASPVLYYARGRAEQNSGNTRAALEDYDRAVSLDPSYEEALSARSALRADKHGKDGSSGQRPLTIPR